MKLMHGVHHRVHHVTAIDSLYVHPVETSLGILIQLFCVWLIGPVAIGLIFAVIAVHATINVLVHSNLKIDHPLGRLLNHSTEQHDRHHTERNICYATITPIWDKLFGTEQNYQAGWIAMASMIHPS